MRRARAYFRWLMLGLNPAQVGAVLATLVITAIGAVVLAMAFRMWNAR